jgi:hypothetical protein
MESAPAVKPRKEGRTPGKIGSRKIDSRVSWLDWVWGRVDADRSAPVEPGSACRACVGTVMSMKHRKANVFIRALGRLELNRVELHWQELVRVELDMVERMDGMGIMESQGCFGLNKHLGKTDEVAKYNSFNKTAPE